MAWRVSVKRQRHRAAKKKDDCRPMRTKVGLFVQKAKDYFILADFIERRVVSPRRKTQKMGDAARLFSDYQGKSRRKKAYAE